MSCHFLKAHGSRIFLLAKMVILSKRRSKCLKFIYLHQNTSFVHPSVAFHPDQTNDLNSSTLNGSLKDSEETNLPNVYNIDTNQYLFLKIDKNHHWIYPFSIHLIRIANWNVPLSSRSLPSPHRKEKMF